LIKDSLDEKYRKSRKHHWATPTFRALRIEVNKDYENLEKFLEIFSGCLKKKGIFEIITFHSIEENIVRKKLRELKQNKIIKLITKRPFEATLREIAKNPKSKRAKLWVAEMK
jgi:16S rRNA (cytosine1402-N4)-methyltransferase